MSLSTALNSALSGLQAKGRATEVVSTNVANALTPGYARRDISLGTNAVGSGVLVAGIIRQGDPVILQNRRTAEAAVRNADIQARFQAQLTQLIGAPGVEGSVSARLAAFESALVQSASNPESLMRLERVQQSASDLVRSIYVASTGVTEQRSRADRSIGIEVARLNQTLDQVRQLNNRIVTTQASGGDTASLIDQRQLLIDQINETVPLREVPRGNGQVALYALGGAILLDGKAAEFGFSTSNTVTPYMSIGGGTLSGLTIDGRAVATDGTGPIRGGSLAGLFAVRDDLGTEALAELDALARDLVERFSAPGLDPTRTPGDPGFFTDGGLAFAPANETGLSERLSVNALVDPGQGGQVWRIRAGLGAAGPGAPGDSSLIQSLQAALEAPRSPASGRFSGIPASAQTLTSQVASWAALKNDLTQQEMTFTSASLRETRQIELAGGVDSDAELTNLMTIEKAYAANARVLATVDEMMETLLRLG